MSSYNDMNDVLSSEKFNIDDIKRTADYYDEGVDRNKGKRKQAEEGYTDFIEVVQEIADSADEKGKVKKFPLLEMITDAQRMEKVTLANVYRPEDFRKNIMRLSEFYGMKMVIQKLYSGMAKIKRQWEKEEKTKRYKEKVLKNNPYGDDPHPDTWKMLRKKMFRLPSGDVVEGQPYQESYNAEIVLTTDPRWVGRIKWCNHSHCVHLDERPITDVDETRINQWLTRTYQFEYEGTKLSRLIHMIAADNQYHPVQDWLNNLPTWDKTPRLKNLFTHYIPTRAQEANSADILLGSKDEETEEFFQLDYTDLGITDEENSTIIQNYGIRFMISIIARQMEPGCKQDVTLTLIGGQGENKSQAVEVLPPIKQWWTDERIDMKNKDAYLTVLGKVLVEIPECEGLSSYNYQTTKAFLSKRHCRFRRPYGHNVEEFAFGHTYIATSNQDRLAFLNDPTGTRRFWVLYVGMAKLKDIERDKEQLYAEALHYYNLGEQHWLTKVEQEASRRLNERFRAEDSWEERVGDWIKGFLNKDEKFSLARVLEEALDIPPKYQKQRDQNRASEILKMIGCEKAGRRFIGKAYQHVWSLGPDLREKMLNEDSSVKIPEKNDTEKKKGVKTRKEKK